MSNAIMELVRKELATIGIGQELPLRMIRPDLDEEIDGTVVRVGDGYHLFVTMVSQVDGKSYFEGNELYESLAAIEGAVGAL